VNQDGRRGGGVRLPDPYAEGAAGHLTTEIQVDVAQNGDTATLSYALSMSWLRVARYPIILDPSVTIQPNDVEGKDTWQDANFSTPQGQTRG
jgi:hypothetical protein